MTHSPTAGESPYPYLRPPFERILYLYEMVRLMAADAGFLSRENCALIGSAGAIPIPRKGISYWDPDPWREMIYELVYDAQRWLEQYHMRSMIGAVNSTMKRTMPSPVKKRLAAR